MKCEWFAFAPIILLLFKKNKAEIVTKGANHLEYDLHLLSNSIKISVSIFKK